MNNNVEDKNVELQKKTISLEEGFDNYDGIDLTKEFEWDEPIGKEIW